MAAKSKTLGTLHELFAQYFVNLMQNPRLDEHGVALPMPAAELAVIRAFLKDNNVTADPDAANDVKDVANEARKAMAEAGIDVHEIDRIAEDFANFTGGLNDYRPN